MIDLVTMKLDEISKEIHHLTTIRQTLVQVLTLMRVGKSLETALHMACQTPHDFYQLKLLLQLEIELHAHNQLSS